MEGHQGTIEESVVDTSPTPEDVEVITQAVLHHPAQDQGQEIDTEVMERREMMVTESLRGNQIDQHKTMVVGNPKMEPEMVKVLQKDQRRQNRPTTRVPIKISILSQPRLQLTPLLPMLPDQSND